MGKIETIIPGDFSDTEAAILKYIYEHPEWDIGTFALIEALKPAPDEATEKAKQQRQEEVFKEVQYGIETLYVAKCLKGTRLRTHAGEVYFNELKLTPAGEAAAIKDKRRIKKMIIDQANRPDWAKMREDGK